MRKIIFVLALALVFTPFLPCLRAQEKDTGYILEEGFFEKEYSVQMEKTKEAVFQLMKNQMWLPMQVTELEDGGVLCLYGVFDESGEFGQGKGGHVQIRITSKGEHRAIVGIKWGNGNEEASRRLHKELQEILAAAKG